ncbi:hypothetical protein V5799_021694 [Amblyomma americanum]|uniref:Peptidase M13 N-terminal domain-containing protein n=1 Tax=Amblyomma americanum TaxID=6943 RepID=A0AAQ4FMQ8_AMBAM
MDPGTNPQGKQQHGPIKESRQKRRRSSRPKRSKQPTTPSSSNEPPAANTTVRGGCTESPALAPLPGACSASASGGAPSQPSEQSKPTPRRSTKSGSSGTAAVPASAGLPALPAHAAKAATVLNKSKPNLDASRSKPCDMDAFLGGTHKTAKTSPAAGVKAATGTEKCLDQPAAPTVPDSKVAARPYVGGAAATDAPVPVSRLPPGAPQPTVQPTSPKQAGSRPRRKSKAPSAAKNRNVDIDNRFSAEESFTPASSRDAAMKKSNVVSSSHWSFYPMNLTFVTEINCMEERYLYVVVAGVLAVVFALAVVTLLLVLSSKPSKQYGMCDTAECMEARDYLDRLLNTNKDACSNFYGYVCDSWMDRATDQDGPSSFLGDSVADSIATISSRLLAQDVQPEREEPEAKSPPNSEKGAEDARVLAALYQRCHRYVLEEATGASFKTTLTWMRERLNWTMIRAARTYRDLVGLIARTSLLAGFHTVFSLDLLSDNGKTVLRLSSGKSLLGKLAMWENRAELESHLQRVVEDSDERALIVSLDELIAADLDFVDRIALEDESLPLPALLENLVPGVTTSDWMVALNLVVSPGEETMRASDTSFASGADSVRSAFSKIHNHSSVSEAALYLASHLDSDLLSLELAREHAASHPSKTDHFCLDLARACFGYAWPDLFAGLLDSDHSAQTLYTMFNELKEASRGSAFFRWLPESTWDDAIEEIDKEALIFVADDSKTASRSELDYPSFSRFLMEVGGDFVRLYLRMVEHEHSLRLRQPPTRLQLLLVRLEQRSQLAHSASQGSVLVPTIFQRPPLLYSTGVPAYFNYGTVGALLAAAILEIIAPSAAAGSNQQQKLPGEHNDTRWTPAALRRYNSSIRCLQRLYRRLGLQTELGGNEEEQRRAMFLGAHGLRLAYDTLATIFRRTAVNSDAFSALWPDAQVVFFTRYCLLWCNSDQRPNPLSPRGNCLLALHNMPEFDNAFECSERSGYVSDNCVL